MTSDGTDIGRATAAAFARAGAMQGMTSLGHPDRPEEVTDVASFPASGASSSGPGVDVVVEEGAKVS